MPSDFSLRAFRVELHQGAGDAELHCVGLTTQAPPPSTLAMMLNEAAVSVDANGAFAAERCGRGHEYSSNSRPLP